jgi:transposase-like protein
MVGQGEKFGRKKEDAIAALLTQRNIEEAAKAAGIGANTLLRWLNVPEFQAAYREARRPRSVNPSHGSSREPLRQPPLY